MSRFTKRGVRTLVFSADAAEEPMYSKLRVHGKLGKVLKNIELFRKSERQNTKYSNNHRVSGVLVDKSQNMLAMKRLWGGLVDQISFVKYNPWENVYVSPISEVKEPCSDLWRRMFIWYDGKMNPCDTDYMSKLQAGNIKDDSLSDIWKGVNYRKLREKHQSGNRAMVFPCNKCVVV